MALIGQVFYKPLFTNMTLEAANKVLIGLLISHTSLGKILQSLRSE